MLLLKEENMSDFEFEDFFEVVDEYEGMDKLEIKNEEIVRMEGKSGLPKEVEIDGCGLVRMIESDCYGVDSLRIGAEIIHCTYMKEAPKVIELIKPCKELWLNCADVTGCQLKLEKGGEKLYMGYAKGIEPETDFSGFDFVELNDNDMKYFDSFKFKDGGRVALVACKGFPKKLDLSALQSVDLRGADLSGVEEIIFREGAVVDLSGAKNFPEILDISKCGEVRAKNTNLTGAKKVIYKDNEQANKFINEVDYDTYPVIRIGASYGKDGNPFGGGGMGL